MIDLHPQSAQPPAVQAKPGIDMKDLLAVVFRRRWVILAVALPIMVMAFIATLRSADVVTAGARVLIEASNSDQLQYTIARDDFNEVLATAAQVCMSLPVAEKAATALQDSIPHLAGTNADYVSKLSHVDLRDLIVNNLDCGQVGESRILRIMFSDPSARFALMADRAVTDAFIEYNIESQRNIPAISYFDEQIAAVQSEVDSLMTERAGILNASGYSTYRTSAQSDQSSTGNLELDYQRARSKRMALESTAQQVSAAMVANPEFIPVSDGQRSAVLMDLKLKLEDARMTMATLRTKYQDDAMIVVRQRQLISDARQQLITEEANYLKGLQIDLAQAREAERTYEEIVRKRQTSLESFPDVERRVDSINIQIDTKRDLLKSLQVRRGEVRVRADTDIRISNIIPLDMPTIDTAVGSGRKLLYLGLASIFAIVLGFMTAYFVESQDHRIYSGRQVEQYLEVPVLGAISDTVAYDRRGR